MPSISRLHSVLRAEWLRENLAAPLLMAAGFMGCVGCSAGPGVQTAEIRFALSGTVQGGQQPVQSSLIQLYAAGDTGNRSSSTLLLTAPVYSGADGSFSFTSDYFQCPSSSSQVYLVASGGNPGLAAGTTNGALVLMAVLGPCGQLSSSTHIVINEVTTVAAAWALSPFMASAVSMGTSATNGKGIANAFLNAQLLASNATGAATVLPSNLSIESAKLYALADALAPCVHSDGTSACTALFAAATPSGAPAPHTTLDAAFSIVQHPGQNVKAIFDTIGLQPPYPTALTDPPHDWTMSLTITGGGLNGPASLALDSSGNVWVANYFGVLSAFSPQGTPLSATGYGIGILSESYGLAIDPSNNIWVTNEQTPGHSPTAGSVTAFLGASSSAIGSLLNATSYFSDPSIDFPRAVAADPNGNILIANYANSSATIYNGSGQLIKSNVAANSAALPVAITADATQGLWLANQGDNSVTHIASDGTLIAHTLCCDGANGIATDSTGNAWVANYTGSSVTEISPNGAISIAADTNGGIADNNPSGITIDAAQNIWVANFRGNTISELAGNAGTATPGAGLSPNSGYGLDANLVLPFGIAPDTTGNIWVTNFDNATVTMFFGLATPTSTPLLPSPIAP